MTCGSAGLSRCKEACGHLINGKSVRNFVLEHPHLNCVEKQNHLLREWEGGEKSMRVEDEEKPLNMTLLYAQEVIMGIKSSQPQNAGEGRVHKAHPNQGAAAVGGCGRLESLSLLQG